MKGKKHHEGHMKHEHEMHRAKGGRTDMKVSGNPDVFEEADEKKRGGKVKKAKKHHERHEMEGHKPHHRMDRRGRKSGGRVGADKAPLSSAHNSSNPPEPNPNGGN